MSLQLDQWVFINKGSSLTAMVTLISFWTIPNACLSVYQSTAPGGEEADTTTHRPKAHLQVLQDELHTERTLCSPPTWSCVPLLFDGSFATRRACIGSDTPRGFGRARIVESVLERVESPPRSHAALDFTTLHAEALSLNYMSSPIPSPPPELELMSMD
ncbi:hypothetical protein FE257_009640 [Aspergillus nanangensis]|uniref:Uncharacterized protein n=1 Tax=Aspergillus nanangensis TaxID=2582783 RepID=A0AAD4CLA7_ASPNN|nr:hypothetical protein FE257_009640 [Aspergillus nanangensis]